MKRWDVLRTIERIADANGIDDLLSAPPDEAGVLYALMRECARGEAGRCFDAICRVAVRRGVTPSYLVDRADVLLASAEMRQDGDLYQILGVPPLASAEQIRTQWRDVVKRCHPDIVGGASSEHFRTVQAAYDVLGDSKQRAGYEQLWRERLAGIIQARTMADAVELEIPPTRRTGSLLRAVAGRVTDFLQTSWGPTTGEAVGVTREGLRLDGPADMPRDETGRVAGPRTTRDAAQRAADEENTMDDVLRRSASMLEAVRGIDQRLSGAGFEGVEAIAHVFEQLHKALATVSLQEIDSTLTDIDETRRALNTISRDLTRLRKLKQSLDDGAAGQ